MDHEVLSALEAVIRARQTADPEQSYVAKLLHGKEDALLKKIGEEATETVLAAKAGSREALIYESADLVFHLMVVLARRGIVFDEVLSELRRRFGLSGLVEKAQRNKENTHGH